MEGSERGAPDQKGERRRREVEVESSGGRVGKKGVSWSALSFVTACVHMIIFHLFFRPLPVP